ncbi:MAG: hypothetical protein ACP5SA_03445 [Candidatus Micrarchaeia archaeon]
MKTRRQEEDKKEIFIRVYSKSLAIDLNENPKHGLRVKQNNKE